MTIWTAPLPATPTLTATIPAVPARCATIPAIPVAIIAASTIPYIEPNVLAMFSGVGQAALPEMPSQYDSMPGTGIGTLQALANAHVPETAAGGGTGNAACVVKVHSGTVIIHAMFNAIGSLYRDDAPFSGLGSLSIATVPIAQLLAAFNGIGVDSGGATWPATYNGLGTLTAASTPQGTVSEAAGGVGSATAAVAVAGSAVVAAAFSGAGGVVVNENATNSTGAPAFGSVGSLSAVTGGAGALSGLGTLTAQLGLPVAFNSVGTGVVGVSFAGAFNSVGQLSMLIQPQAEFGGSGALSMTVSVIEALTASFSGGGAFTAAPAVNAQFSGVGSLYGTDFAELAATASGAGTATVAVQWSESEAGGFSATGSLSATVLVSGRGAVVALVFNTLDPARISAQNEAYALLFGADALDENHV